MIKSDSLRLNPCEANTILFPQFYCLNIKKSTNNVKLEHTDFPPFKLNQQINYNFAGNQEKLGRERFISEQIIKTLRKAEVILSKGLRVPEIVRELGIAEQIYYRWRKEHRGLLMKCITKTSIG